MLLNIRNFNGRSKVDTCTLLTVVLRIADEDFYRLSTKSGNTLSNFHSDQFIECEENVFETAIIPENKIDICQTKSPLSITSEQGVTV